MQIKSRHGQPGLFIAVEGVDGCGKTTAAKILTGLIKEALPQEQVTSIRAPGATMAGERIRDILLTQPMSKYSELMLFMASHRDTIEAVIDPAVEQGKILICDRFIDTTYAYQGFGRGLLHEVALLHDQMLGARQPDYTIYINASLDICSRRLDARGNKDIFDAMALETRSRIHGGMLQMQEERISRELDRVCTVRNETTEEQLTERLRGWVYNNLVPSRQA